ncbi:sensor histidine kinase [Candidatus Bathyarchaeota archaeon]|nr:sensor histidine kinase [Candidatus Bathyarchaeota archaeon]
MPKNPKSLDQGSLMLSITTYLMIAAVFVRTYLYYPDVRIPAFSLLFLLVILLMVEPKVALLNKTVWAVYLTMQIMIMVSLFLIESDGDTFSLLLLPACMFVTRQYEQVQAWIWVGTFSVAMGIMLFYGHQESAPALIVIYLAAYILVASFSYVIKQNQIAQEKLLAANQQLRRYAEQVEDLTAVNERNHLARELHDSVTQTIFSMTLITRSTRILQDRDPDQVPGKLSELQDLAQDALKEMRALVTQLRPLSISEDGLFPVLEKHIEELNRRNAVNILMDVNEEVSLQLDSRRQQEVFRIVQEALNNVIKHSHAQEAHVSCQQSDSLLTIIVSDDGLGFDPKAPLQDQFHFGLESMRQRAEELEGKLRIESEPGSGTKVICTIPLQEENIGYG